MTVTATRGAPRRAGEDEGKGEGEADVVTTGGGRDRQAGAAVGAWGPGPVAPPRHPKQAAGEGAGAGAHGVPVTWRHAWPLRSSSAPPACSIARLVRMHGCWRRLDWISSARTWRLCGLMPCMVEGVLVSTIYNVDQYSWMDKC